MKDIESQPKLYITGNIGPKNSFLTMFGEEPPFSASDVRQFLDTHKEDKDITVEISSDGGFKNEGIEIYNLLKNSGKNVTTIAYKANSIATVIMLAGSKRLVAENIQFVVHFARIDPINLGMEALTGDDLQRLADETKRSDKQIVDIYCDVLGEENRATLEAAMKDETDIGAKGAIKLGFATGYYKKKADKVTKAHFQNVIIDEYAAELIQNYMTTQKQNDDAKTIADKILNGFKNFVRYASGIKNEVTVVLSDGSSVYLVPVDSTKPDVLDGAAAFTVDENGVPTTTPYADGTYTDGDGKTYVIEKGVIKGEPVASVDAKKELDDLKAEIANKNTELAAKDAEIAQFKTAQVEQNKIMNQLKKDFTEFRKLVPGDKSKDDDSKDDSTKVLDYSKMSRREIVIAMAAEKRQENRTKQRA